MDLIVITPETDHEDEFAQVKKMFDAGLERLHIRKPNYLSVQMEHYIRRIPSKYRDLVTIHGHPVLAREHDLGLHIKPAEIGKDDFYYSKLSVSAHKQEEIEMADGKCDYIFISPVYSSISKKEYKGKAELIALGKMKRKVSKLFALGGITDQNIEEIFENGFDGAAVLGNIWEDDRPIERFLRLQKIVQEIKTATKK